MLFLHLASLASVATSAFAAPKPIVQVSAGLTLNPLFLSQGGPLIGGNVAANVLTSSACRLNQGVGTKAILALPSSLPNLASICVCLQAGIALPTGTTPCAGCPVNSAPVCTNGSCACQCNAGYYTQTKSGKAVCTYVPSTAPCAAPNTRVYASDGTSHCACNPGFISTAGLCLPLTISL